MSIDRVSIGIHGSTPPTVVARVAERVEQAGFRALWINDVPGGDSLAGLAAGAAATTRLRLGSGVVPLDRRSASEILDATATLPADRVTIGVGSGRAQGALARVAESLTELRAGTRAEIVVGALGPKMRALGARVSDGLLLNWLTPEAAATAAREAAPARVVLYARTIMSDDARASLEAEAAAYASYPQYAANFARLGFDALDSTIDGTDPARLAGTVDAYLGSVDELVLRTITPSGSEDELLSFVDAAAASLTP